MARKPRVLFEGALYHIYNRGVARQPIFNEDRDRRTFLKLLSEMIEEYKIDLFAYCLMGNHYHLLLKINKLNLGEAMRRFQSQYVHCFNLNHRRVGPLYQDRFQSKLVENDAYALTALRYIHQNPLKAGIVDSLADYPWSSYVVYSGQFPHPKWLNTDWILSLFSSDPETALYQFIEFHREIPAEDEWMGTEGTGATTGGDGGNDRVMNG